MHEMSDEDRKTAAYLEQAEKEARAAYEFRERSSWSEEDRLAALRTFTKASNARAEFLRRWLSRAGS